MDFIDYEGAEYQSWLLTLAREERELVGPLTSEQMIALSESQHQRRNELHKGFLQQQQRKAIADVKTDNKSIVGTEYLNATETLKDPDLLLRLIEDDGIDAFRSGTYNQVYLIVPRADGTGKEQIQTIAAKAASSDFSTYARRIFSRDYERTEPLRLIAERINVATRMLERAGSRDEKYALKQDVTDLRKEFSKLAEEYKMNYGHRPALHDRVIGEESINSVARQLTTYATTYRTLHLRSFIDTNGWYYDLQNDQYEYIAITKDGYAIKNDAYYYFRKTTKQGANDRPVPCDMREGKPLFEGLFEGFNFLGVDGKSYDGQQRTLFEIFTLWLFYNDHRTMRPIEGMNASPNSGKTTALKIQRMIYDPISSFGSLVKTWGAGKKDDRRDRFVIAAGHAFTVFDNVKRATSEEQDDLCVMATGGSVDTRKLFSDGDLHSMEIQTNVGYTSVNDIATFSDLIRRQIQFKLGESKIAINEDALFDSLITNRPKILHWIFTTLAKAQNILATVNPNEYIKFLGLWKFVMIGDAIAEAMGECKGYVSKMFADMPLQQAQRAIENDAFASALLRYTMNNPEMQLELTAIEIKANVEDYCNSTKDHTAIRDYSWPEIARAVSSKLEYLTPTFKAFKIILERGPLIHGYKPRIIKKQFDDENQGNKSVDNKPDDGSGSRSEPTKKETFSKDDKMFRLIASELGKDGSIHHEPLQKNLVSSGKFYAGEAHQAIEGAVKAGVLEEVDFQTYHYKAN